MDLWIHKVAAFLKITVLSAETKLIGSYGKKAMIKNWWEQTERLQKAKVVVGQVEEGKKIVTEVLACHTQWLPTTNLYSLEANKIP